MHGTKSGRVFLLCFFFFFFFCIVTLAGSYLIVQYLLFLDSDYHMRARVWF